MHCREHALQLQRDRDRFAATGGELAVVGMGTPAMARDFRGELGVDARVLLSRDKEAYLTMDLERASTSQVFSPSALGSSVVRSAGLLRRGKAPAKAPQQDWHQLGGAFVIAPGGELVWEHRSRHPGDLPDHEAMLEALRDAAR
jgi:AhpC/TSA antioxidant enzyme